MQTRSWIIRPVVSSPLLKPAPDFSIPKPTPDHAFVSHRQSYLYRYNPDSIASYSFVAFFRTWCLLEAAVASCAGEEPCIYESL